MNAFFVIIGIIILVGIWIIVSYNSLVRLSQRVREAFSDIDVQLKRRHDLIPNLVSTVKGYATHEEQLLTKITEARAQAVSAQGPIEQAKAENALSQTLRSLFAVVENYPDLKASDNFLKLQDELSDTENKIQAARRFYNGQVRDLNTKLETFPVNIIRSWFSFMPASYFELDSDTERENPTVDFKS